MEDDMDGDVEDDIAHDEVFTIPQPKHAFKHKGRPRSVAAKKRKVGGKSSRTNGAKIQSQNEELTDEPVGQYAVPTKYFKDPLVGFWTSAVMECLECRERPSRKFYSKTSWVQHIKSNHPNIKMMADYRKVHGNPDICQFSHRCRYCGQRFLAKNSIATNHLKFKHQKKLDDYMREFRDDLVLERLSRPVMPSSHTLEGWWEGCIYSCRMCNTTVVSASALENHVALGHNIKGSQELEEKYLNVHGDLCTLKRAHRCQLCSKLVRHEYKNLYQHIVLGHKTDLEKYAKRFEVELRKELADKRMDYIMDRERKILSSPTLQQYLARQKQEREQDRLLLKTDPMSGWFDKCEYLCSICQDIQPSNIKFHRHIRVMHGLTAMKDYRTIHGDPVQLSRHHKCKICHTLIRWEACRIRDHLKWAHKPPHPKLTIKEYGNRFKDYILGEIRKFTSVSSIGGHAIDLQPVEESAAVSNEDLDYFSRSDAVSLVPCRHCDARMTRKELEIHLSDVHKQTSVGPADHHLTNCEGSAVNIHPVSYWQVLSSSNAELASNKRLSEAAASPASVTYVRHAPLSTTANSNTNEYAWTDMVRSRRNLAESGLKDHEINSMSGLIRSGLRFVKVGAESEEPGAAAAAKRAARRALKAQENCFSCPGPRMRVPDPAGPYKRCHGHSYVEDGDQVFLVHLDSSKTDENLVAPSDAENCDLVGHIMSSETDLAPNSLPTPKTSLSDDCRTPSIESETNRLKGVSISKASLLLQHSGQTKQHSLQDQGKFILKPNQLNEQQVASIKKSQENLKVATDATERSDTRLQPELSAEKGQKHDNMSLVSSKKESVAMLSSNIHTKDLNSCQKGSSLSSTKAAVSSVLPESMANDKSINQASSSSSKDGDATSASTRNVCQTSVITTASTAMAIEAPAFKQAITNVTSSLIRSNRFLEGTSVVSEPSDLRHSQSTLKIMEITVEAMSDCDKVPMNSKVIVVPTQHASPIFSSVERPTNEIGKSESSSCTQDVELQTKKSEKALLLDQLGSYTKKEISRGEVHQGRVRRSIGTQISKWTKMPQELTKVDRRKVFTGRTVGLIAELQLSSRNHQTIIANMDDLQHRIQQAKDALLKCKDPSDYSPVVNEILRMETQEAKGLSESLNSKYVRTIGTQVSHKNGKGLYDDEEDHQQRMAIIAYIESGLPLDKTCPGCRRKLAAPKNLYIHLRSKHDIVVGEKNDGDEEDEPHVVLQDKVNCPVCSIAISRKSLRRHLRVKHPQHANLKTT